MSVSGVVSHILQVDWDCGKILSRSDYASATTAREQIKNFILNRFQGYNGRAVSCVMFKKILVAVDGSEPSLHALEVAAGITVENDAELTILSVAPFPPPMFTEDAMPTYLPQYQDDLRESYKRMLKKTDQELKKKHQNLRTVPIVMEGKPAKTIIEAAQARTVDLIVVGNRGSGGILSWMLGSVSQQVVNNCTVPVLVVKDQKYCEI
jgi:nucleotide-binding universal stress UspA family protein